MPMIYWQAEWLQKIIAEIQRRKLTQAHAAEILGVDQPKISAIKQGKLSRFSTERLMRFLLLLGQNIEISITGRSKAGSAVRLRVA